MRLHCYPFSDGLEDWAWVAMPGGFIPPRTLWKSVRAKGRVVCWYAPFPIEKGKEGQMEASFKGGI